jgi:anaerobic selenocysteine-containing dehydrogenase
VLLEHLWPQLSKIVAMDYRMSETALHADIVLPATQHHEKVALNMPTPWTMLLTMSDAAVPPAGEARGEWEVLAELCRSWRSARARGVDETTRPSRTVRALGDLGPLHARRRFARQIRGIRMVADAVEVGTPGRNDARDFRQQGYATRVGLLALATAQASPFPRRDARAAARSRRTRSSYPTLRARAVPDRPSLVPRRRRGPARTQEAPAMGGDHPFRCRADTRAGACTR